MPVLVVRPGDPVHRNGHLLGSTPKAQNSPQGTSQPRTRPRSISRASTDRLLTRARECLPGRTATRRIRGANRRPLPYRWADAIRGRPIAHAREKSTEACNRDRRQMTCVGTVPKKEGGDRIREAPRRRRRDGDRGGNQAGDVTGRVHSDVLPEGPSPTTGIHACQRRMDREARDRAARVPTREARPC